jgi:hypothetical protein
LGIVPLIAEASGYLDLVSSPVSFDLSSAVVGHVVVRCIRG